MKITQALDQLLRATRKAEEANGKGADGGAKPAGDERPLPMWVQRANERNRQPETPPPPAPKPPRTDIYDPPPLPSETTTAFSYAAAVDAEDTTARQTEPGIYDPPPLPSETTTAFPHAEALDAEDTSSRPSAPEPTPAQDTTPFAYLEQASAADEPEVVEQPDTGIYDPPPLVAETTPLLASADEPEPAPAQDSPFAYLEPAGAVDEPEVVEQLDTGIYDPPPLPAETTPALASAEEPEPAPAQDTPFAYFDDSEPERVEEAEPVEAFLTVAPEPEPEPEPVPAADDPTWSSPWNATLPPEPLAGLDTSKSGRQGDEEPAEPDVFPDVPLLTSILDELSARVRADSDRETATESDAETTPDTEPYDAVEPAPTTDVPSEPPEEEPATELVPFSASGEFAHLEAGAAVAESLNLGYHLGSVVERVVAAAGRGSDGVTALREAGWLIERYIALIEQRPIGADLHLSATRLARAGDSIASIKALAAALDEPPAPMAPEAPPVEEPREPHESQPAVEAHTAVAETPASDEPEVPAFGRIRRLSPDSLS